MDNEDTMLVSKDGKLIVTLKQDDTCDFEWDLLSSRWANLTKCDKKFIEKIANKHGLQYIGEKLKKTDTCSHYIISRQYNVFLSASNEIEKGLERPVVAFRMPKYLQNMTKKDFSKEANELFCEKYYDELLKEKHF